jgi:hypothetical protein
LRIVKQPQEGTARLVVDLDFFGSHSGFAFELLGRHKVAIYGRIEQGKAGRINGGLESLFLKVGKPVVADLFTDNCSVFLFNETGIVFPVVAAAGKGEGFCGAPDFGGMIDIFGSIVTVELQNWERGVVFDVREGIERPGMGVIEEGA